MNRIVLIGNGFDLAHGLPTQYQDFIDWYWKQCIDKLKSTYADTYTDDLCTFLIKETTTYSTWVLFFYTKGLFTKDIPYKEFLEETKDQQVFSISQSPFFERICKCIETKNWVDIENEYYELLKEYMPCVR